MTAIHEMSDAAIEAAAEAQREELFPAEPAEPAEQVDELDDEAIVDILLARTHRAGIARGLSMAVEILGETVTSDQQLELLQAGMDVLSGGAAVSGSEARLLRRPRAGAGLSD